MISSAFCVHFSQLCRMLCNIGMDRVTLRTQGKPNGSWIYIQERKAASILDAGADP